MTAIDKALDTLFLLSERSAPQRLSDLASALQMPRSSVHRALAPLVARGLVQQDEYGRYTPGLRLLALGIGGAGRLRVASSASCAYFVPIGAARKKTSTTEDNADACNDALRSERRGHGLGVTTTTTVGAMHFHNDDVVTDDELHYEGLPPFEGDTPVVVLASGMTVKGNRRRSGALPAA